MKALIAGLFTILILHNAHCSSPCKNFDVSITQKIENEGFHRDLKWLVEIIAPTVVESLQSSRCNLLIYLNVPPGMYVNPDEIADLKRFGKISAFIEGEVNIETPLHESTEHVTYIFIPSNNISELISIELPIHLRYQRAQITGGFGKVQLAKPSFLVNCSNEIKVCGHVTRLEAPCTVEAKEFCLWKNITYQALFEDVELFIPIGDLDDYPLVSIVSLLLGCAGCIYVLSILSTAPL